MRKATRIFSLYDKDDGENLLLCSATARECADYLGISLNAFWSRLSKQESRGAEGKHILIFRDGDKNE